MPPPPLDAPAAWIGRFEGAETLPADEGSASAVPLRTVSEPGRQAFEEKVEKVRRSIARGDYFQANISRRDSAWFEHYSGLPRQAVSFALQQRFGAHIEVPGFSVLSASPELFLSLEEGTLRAEPIKGTRPRGATPEEDQALLEALQADPKDRAENIMIADLMRNDLAKVCEDGTMDEPVICGVRTLPHVHHLYSRIEGRLRVGLPFAEALRAAFPCGSVTGAPKLAAMRAIAELEGEGRGPYCGTVFAVTKERAVASVAIRTAVADHRRGRIDARSGGGITWRSEPAAEYAETEAKAYLFRLLTGAR
nr:anthranilate synthase component I family protein [Parvularcula maris]